MKMLEKEAPHVVVVGGGFGGLTAARSLRGKPVRVTVVDRTNHHLFQPLLYQVAMAGLSPADIAQPIRSVLSGQENCTVLLANVARIDLARRTVHLDGISAADAVIEYDFLIVATGAETAYFGHDAWEEFAPGLKTLDDAIEIRQRVLVAFETAERESDPRRRAELLTFVVIGGGPTGVELAGALAELSRNVLAKDFRHINPALAKVHLLEGGKRILGSFAEELSARAVEQLAELGVIVRTGAMVTNIDAHGVTLAEGDRIRSAIVLWGAGVRAAPLTKTLGVPLDRWGRVVVGPDCAIPGHPEVFVIGDAALFTHQDGQALPGVSQVAMQMARCATESILLSFQGEPHVRFKYFDKGNMATIGRSRAICDIRGTQATGFLAWMLWLLVHIWFLIGFRNRLVVMISWFWSYVTYRRGARIITGLGFHEFPPLPPSIRPQAHEAPKPGETEHAAAP